MKNLKNLMLLAATLLLVACTGLTARQQSLLPAMKLAWTGVSTDVRAGIEESLTAQRIDAATAELQRAGATALGTAIEAGDAPSMLGVPWGPLAESANFGIDRRAARGEISTGVAGSLKERVNNFGQAMTVFLERR